MQEQTKVKCKHKGVRKIEIEHKTYSATGNLLSWGSYSTRYQCMRCGKFVTVNEYINAETREDEGE